MIELLLLTLSTFAFLIFLHHILELYRIRRMPPGPIGLPIIRNLLDVGSSPHESLLKLSQKHGPLMTIRLGSSTRVVASTPEMAREILQRHDEICSGRAIPDAVTALEVHNMSVLWISTDKDWRTIRKALNTYLTHQYKLDTLRSFRENMVEGMLDFLKESALENKPICIGKLVFAVSLNMISNTMFSKSVTNYQSEDTKGFIEAIKTLIQVAGKLNMSDIFPVLRPFDPQNLRRRAKAAYGWFDEQLQGFINERIKHRESKLPMFGDLLDSLLDYSESNPADFNLVHIKILLMDLFVAGSEANANITEWALTELLLNPDMFAKVRKEVASIVGEDGKIKEEKVLDLPYLQAVIKETMRLHLFAPFLVHKTEKEVKLGGYTVPKDTELVVNVWAITRDPRNWEDPLRFMPERFLENKVEYKGQHFQFLPFGSGRRICPGVPLAHRVLNLMVATLVYHFDWKLPHAKEDIDMNIIFGLALLRATPLVAYPISVN